MKIIARHERDDRDIELEPEQVAELEKELGCDFAEMQRLGVREFDGPDDGWHYRFA